MPLDRDKKIAELTDHLAAVAALSEELHTDRMATKEKLLQEAGGWSVPSEAYDHLGLDDSPVSEAELVAWLESKDDAIQSIREREQLLSFVKAFSEAAVKIAPSLIAQYQAKKERERLEKELERRRAEEEGEGEE